MDEELTEEAVELIGRAYAGVARKAGARRVTVGRDCRAHSERLSRALIGGLSGGGLEVIDLGTVTTPIQYFSPKLLKLC